MWIWVRNTLVVLFILVLLSPFISLAGFFIGEAFGACQKAICRKKGHRWEGCVCKRCGETRHLLEGCTCVHCGQQFHAWHSKRVKQASSCSNCSGEGYYWAGGQVYSCGCNSEDGYELVEVYTCSRCGKEK